jgi:hypothetical protein
MDYDTFADLGTRFAAAMYPGATARPVFMQEIIPLLDRAFDLRAEQLLRCFQQMYSLANAYAARRL